MRDAIGGTVNLFLVAVFMVVISGYMAFNISYMKAFKVKNKIIDLIEQYEGDCKPGDTSNVCANKIKEFKMNIGYSSSINQSNICSEVTVAAADCQCDQDEGYCITKKIVKHAGEGGSSSASPTYSTADDMAERAYYTVATQVNLDVPIIRNVLPNLRVFTITGDTKVIRVNRKT
jgi:hypothetical protein